MVGWIEEPKLSWLAVCRLVGCLLLSWLVGCLLVSWLVGCLLVSWLVGWLFVGKLVGQLFVGKLVGWFRKQQQEASFFISDLVTWWLSDITTSWGWMLSSLKMSEDDLSLLLLMEDCCQLSTIRRCIAHSADSICLLTNRPKSICILITEGRKERCLSILQLTDPTS